MSSSTSLQKALALLGSTDKTSSNALKAEPATPPTTPLNGTSTSTNPQNGMFEASFTGLDLSEFQSNDNPNNPSKNKSASYEYLQWKQRQKDLNMHEEMEEKRVQTHVNYMLANQSLEKVLIASNEKKNKNDISQHNKQFTKTVPFGAIPKDSRDHSIFLEVSKTGATGAIGLSSLESTLELMHGYDTHGAKKENHKRRIPHSTKKKILGTLKHQRNSKPISKLKQARNKVAMKKKTRKIKH